MPNDLFCGVQLIAQRVAWPAQPLQAALQVIEAHGAVTRIAVGRLQPHPRGENIPDLQQAQPIEADQRYLLSELIDGDIADSEDRDAADAEMLR